MAEGGREENDKHTPQFTAPRRRKYEEEVHVKDTIRIIAVGKTGSGKSSTGNTVMGKFHFESDVSGSSITNSCRDGKITLSGKDIQFVDTPGFFKTDMSIEQVKQEIIDCFSMVAPGPHVILYFIKIGRFTEEDKDSLQHFRQLFPGNPYQHTIVMFTGSDNLKEKNDLGQTEMKKIEEDYLIEIPPEFKIMLQKCDQRKMFFSNKSSDLKKQTESLMTVIDRMVVNNKYAHYANDNRVDMKIDKIILKSSKDNKHNKWEKARNAFKIVEYASYIVFPMGIILAINGYVIQGLFAVGIGGLIELGRIFRQKQEKSKFARVLQKLKKGKSICVVS